MFCAHCQGTAHAVAVQLWIDITHDSRVTCLFWWCCADLESVVNDVEGASPMRRTRKQELMAYATGKAPGTISQAGMFLDVNAKAKQMV